LKGLKLKRDHLHIYF